MASRLRMFIKLGFLLGVPVGLVGGLVGSGIYVGHTRREAVLAFERDVLGMEVPVAASATPSPPVAAPTPIPADPPPKPPPVKVEPVAPVATPATPPAIWPAPPGLEVALRTPRTVTVKVFVGSDLAAVREDWLTYASELTAEASQHYEAAFGIRLELRGVALWKAVPGVEPLDDLRARPREGAELVLGLTDRAATAQAAADRPSADAPENGGVALVPAIHGRNRPHQLPLLRAIGAVFGAVDVTDPNTEAWKRGSYMSDGTAAEGQAPVIDDENRRRILVRKSLPFARGGVP